jgi:FMN reductase
MALKFTRDFGAETKTYAGKDLMLPIYDPDSARETDQARPLIEDLRRADGVILSSPCYHGGISGLIKNAIDYTEEMRNDQRAYLDGRAIGVIACGHGNQGPAMVLAQLRQIGHSLRGWNVPLGIAINSAVVRFEHGVCLEVGLVKQIEIMAGQIAEHARKSMHDIAEKTP